MISFELFQVYIWAFVVIGWLGAGIISVAAVTEIIKLFRGVK